MTRFVMKAALLLLMVLPAFSLCAGDEAYWIDVRTADEYAAGHVNQAVNIPYEEVGVRISEVTTDKEATIYVYCRSGRRSGIAKEALDGLGYLRVVNAGGLEEAMVKAAETAPAQ